MLVRMVFLGHFRITPDKNAFPTAVVKSEGTKTLTNFIVSYKPTTSTLFTATANSSSFDNGYDTCSFLDSVMDDRLHLTWQCPLCSTIFCVEWGSKMSYRRSCKRDNGQNPLRSSRYVGFHSLRLISPHYYVRIWFVAFRCLLLLFVSAFSPFSIATKMISSPRWTTHERAKSNPTKTLILKKTPDNTNQPI